MHLVKLASLVTCLSLVACQPGGEDEGADEAETGSASESSSAASESESSGTSETTAGTTESSTTESSTTDSSTSDSSSSESTSSSTTIGESTSDTGFESCEMIEMLYDDLVNSPLNAACSADADCHVVEGHCWMGLGGCWYVVNQNLQQTDLEQLANGFSGLGCFGPICLCLEAPDAVGCVDGTCMPLP